MATVIRAGIAIVADLLIYELNQLQHKKNRRRRRMWIREWIKRRDVFGASATFLREVELEDPETFRNHLRLTTNQFQELLSVVKDFIKKKDTLMRPALEPRIKLQITMRYLATGDSFSTLEHMYRIPKSTISKFLPQVLKAIYEGLKDYVKMMPLNNLNVLAINNEERLDEMRQYNIERRALKDASNPFNLNEKYFMKLLRLNKIMAQAVFNRISEQLNQTENPVAVPIVLKFFASLYFYATGSYQRTLGQSFNLSMAQRTISRAVSEVLKCSNRKCARTRMDSIF
ncbi:hypothetical protein MML48_10g00001229 [Holotrichia oblita]|uniref:Uncharacterized protein n=1 Tax=Holotrichia oblita TaxID=644536 RepID=A0ACB9SJV9_HOLOL|nr:hypothetical protein MML48_10g00001229 [Holotrichia oblita]